MAYVNPPDITEAGPGSFWTREQAQQFLVENIRALHAGVSADGTGFARNEVIVGSADGTPQGLSLLRGRMIMGGEAGSVTRIAPGSDGQVLVVRNGIPRWETLDTAATILDLAIWSI